MNKEEKIAAIYKEMASKERALGCRVSVKYKSYYHGETGGEEYYDKKNTLIVGVNGVARNEDIDLDSSDLTKTDSNGYIEDLETLVEIIGHPLMIGDVIYYIRKKYWNNHSWFHSDRSKLVDLWSKEREPIEAQYDECIDYVYSLIPRRLR